MDEYSGDRIAYTEALYSIFLADIVNNDTLTLFGKQVRISSKLDHDNRHERFWHIITDPHNPSMHDIRCTRAERMPWIRATIDNANDNDVLIYERIKNRQNKTYLFLPSEQYIVILTERKNTYYINTAFYIDYTYKLDEYRREYTKFGPKTKTAP